MKETLSVILIAHNEEQAIGPMLEGLLATYDREILSHRCGRCFDG